MWLDKIIIKTKTVVEHPESQKLKYLKTVLSIGDFMNKTEWEPNDRSCHRMLNPLLKRKKNEAWKLTKGITIWKSYYSCATHSSSMRSIHVWSFKLISQ